MLLRAGRVQGLQRSDVDVECTGVSEKDAFNGNLLSKNTRRAKNGSSIQHIVLAAEGLFLLFVQFEGCGALSLRDLWRSCVLKKPNSGRILRKTADNGTEPDRV